MLGRFADVLHQAKQGSGISFTNLLQQFKNSQAPSFANILTQLKNSDAPPFTTVMGQLKIAKPPSFATVLRFAKGRGQPRKIVAGGIPIMVAGGTIIKAGVYTNHFETLKKLFE